MVAFIISKITFSARMLVSCLSRLWQSFGLGLRFRNETFDAGSCCLVGSHSFHHILGWAHKLFSFRSTSQEALRGILKLLGGVVGCVCVMLAMDLFWHGLGWYRLNWNRSASSVDLVPSSDFTCFSISSTAHFLIDSGLRLDKSTWEVTWLDVRSLSPGHTSLDQHGAPTSWKQHHFQFEVIER